MTEIELRVGRLSLRQYKPGHWHILVFSRDVAGPVYAVAEIVGGGDEYPDLRTVGGRPWQIEGVSVAEFMRFAALAMGIVDEASRPAD